MLRLVGLALGIGSAGGILAQATGSDNGPLVAVGIAAITALGGVITKLFIELQRVQTRLDSANLLMVKEVMPALGEAIAEMRETRRERGELRPVLEDVAAVLKKVSRQLDRPRRAG